MLTSISNILQWLVSGLWWNVSLNLGNQISCRSFHLALSPPYHHQKNFVCPNIYVSIDLVGWMISFWNFYLFTDVVSIPKTNENFRLLYDTKGRFRLHSVRDDEAKVFFYMVYIKYSDSFAAYVLFYYCIVDSSFVVFGSCVYRLTNVLMLMNL